MSLNKRVKGDFLIESVEGDDSITIKSQSIHIKGLDRFVDDPDIDGTPNVVNTVTIDGNLIVTGNTDTINTTNTSVADTYITLNEGQGGGDGVGFGTGTSGILVDRGIAANGDAGIRFNESINKWELKNADGTLPEWKTIEAGLGGGNEVVDDLSPQLGGALDVNGHAITSAANGNIIIQADGTGQLRINQELSLQEQVTDETPTAGYNKLYAKTPEAGGTGLFVSNNTVVDEVVSRRKSIIHGLLF